MFNKIIEKLDDIIEGLTSRYSPTEFEETERNLLGYHPEQVTIKLYHSFLNSVLLGINPQIAVLGEGYEFSSLDTKDRVFEYLLPDALSNSSPIKLRADGDVLKFDTLCITGISGIACGAVCFNTDGLLFYIGFSSINLTDQDNVIINDNL